MRRLLIVISVFVIGGVVLYHLNPTSYWFMPKCPFKLITGFSGPGCGIQRVIYSTLHGHIVEAIQYNYYLLYSVPYAMLFIVEWILPKGNGRDKLKSIIENKSVVNFYIVTFLLWLIVRNVLKI